MVDRLGPYELNTIVTGDARILAESIPDESVDLIFCDPIYQNIDDYRWLAETAARVLKPGGNVLMQCGHYFLPRIFNAIQDIDLLFVWLVSQEFYGCLGMMNAIRIRTGWKPWIWYSKGKRGGGWVDDKIISPEIDKYYHKWGDGTRAFIRIINALTDMDSIVFDPFTGGGTVPAVCKMLSRNYLAFEIEPTTADRARERVAMTQPPLFVVQPEQAVMELVNV